MTDKRERLKKVYALALAGVDGEQAAAKAILEKLLKKYDLDFSDLDEDIVNGYVLEYHGEEQEQLLIQCIYKVTNKPLAYNKLQYVESGRTCRTKLKAYCTEAQKVEILFLFDFYKKLWEKERAALLVAFIQKHSLFGNASKGGGQKRYTDDELKKIFALMDGLSDDQPLKQLTGSSKKG